MSSALSYDQYGSNITQESVAVEGNDSLMETLVAFSKAQPATVTITLLTLAFLMYQFLGAKGNDLPIINPQPLSHKLNPTKRMQLAAETKDNIIAARKKYGPDQIFRVNSLAGELIVLPPRFINEIRNDQDLLPQDPEKTAHTYIPGFDPFLELPDMLTPIVNKYINKVLGKLTKMLSDETAIALSTNLGESKEWHEIKPNSDLLPVVSRISTRVFMGEEMCANEEWLRVSSEYTNLVFPLIGQLMAYPTILTRKLVHRFLPQCKELRAALDRCRKVLQPVVDGRKEAVAEALRRGDEPPRWDDSLEWFRREFGEVDFATKQIQMSMAAIHTTTDLLAETLVRIARHPEHVPALREEAIRVLSAEGWKKTAMYNLQFMDSFIKEAQRMRPALVSTMQRTVGKNHTLSNGVTLKKGQMVIADLTHMWDSEFFPEAQTFDPYRFLRMRGTDKDSISQLASTSDLQNGFGHGKHACPGRFFAANEIKILLCHMLLKYDFKLADETKEPTPVFVGLQIIGDPMLGLLVRRREPELDLGSIQG